MWNGRDMDMFAGFVAPRSHHVEIPGTSKGPNYTELSGVTTLSNALGRRLTRFATKPIKKPQPHSPKKSRETERTALCHLH